MSQFLHLRSAQSGAAFVGQNDLDTLLWDATRKMWTVGPGGGGGAVASVFGRTGAVAAATGDYDSDQIDNVSSVSGASVSDALETLALSAGAVASVFGRSGVVVALAGDYAASKVTNDSSVPGATTKDALNALLASTGGVSTVFGRSGAVVAVNGDYTASKITNDSSVTGATTKDALNAVAAAASAALAASGVTSAFGRTGAVLAVNGDYTASKITNDSNIPGATTKDALNRVQISGGFVAPAAAANLGATPALDFSVNRYLRGVLDLNAVPTIVMPLGYECFLELQQPATGGPTVVTAWPANVDWTDGVPPTLSTSAGAKDILRFLSDGVNLRGWAQAMNVS